MALKIISEHVSHGGVIGFYEHPSIQTGTVMKFSVFVPPQAKAGKRPALYFLAGLTCTEETFMMKAGALRYAAEAGLIIVANDTSPRGLHLPGEHVDWDFGSGAGFYLDAEAEPWAPHYRMYSYVTRELPALVEANFPIDPARRGISGHSMGGHGALVLALKNPSLYQSVSAFAPIAHPMIAPWGIKAFSNYLGPDQSRWEAWDASLLMRKHPIPSDILVDLGNADKWIADNLRPDALEEAARTSGQKLTLRRHDGYDHSYWFVQSFIPDHIEWHAERLNAG
jgi:S-formylglutathione hydrolase